MEEAATMRKKKIPVLPWMRSPIDVSKFQPCPLDIVPCLDHRLKTALEKMGFSSLFAVQIAVWQEIIGPGSFERDVCINSPTGTGKTLAYALPILQKLSNRAVRCLRALVVLPTRDLALQVKEVFAALASAVGLSVGLAVGQTSIADEISQLVKRPSSEAGICYDPDDLPRELQTSVDILVATPGRLMDHINYTKGFTLEHLCYLVVDETDRMLREAYQAWLPTVLKMVCSHDESLILDAYSYPHHTLGPLKTIRRCGTERGFKGKPCPRLAKMVLSATLTQDPSKLIQLDLHHPLLLTTGQRRYQLPKKLESYRLICKSKLKRLYLVALLQKLGGEKCIVFASSVNSLHRLCTFLNKLGDLKLKISEYSGHQPQSVRSKTLKAFRDGEIQVLVSSDAMTHGMDVEAVRNVINYDMPPYIKTYIHRVGRTARAGKTGRCFTLLSKKKVKRFEKLLHKADQDPSPLYLLPPDSIETLCNDFPDIEKWNKDIETETSKKRKIHSRIPRSEKERVKEE